MEIIDKIIESEKSLENKLILDSFKIFDINSSWMEAKTHTKLGKLLTKGVTRVYSDLNFKSDSIVCCTPRHMEFQLKNRNLTSFELYTIISILQKIESDIVLKYISITDRLTRNGKYPKWEEIRLQRLEIKSSLDFKMAQVINQICKEWRHIIFKKTSESILNIINNPEKKKLVDNCLEEHIIRKNNRKNIESLLHYVQMGVLKHEGKGLRYCTDDEILNISSEHAASQTETFFYKMAMKLRDMKITSDILVGDGGMDRSNPFESVLNFKINEDTKFTMINKIVLNYSPLGTPFYQYPCTFHNVMVNGKNIVTPSESLIKLLMKTQL